MSKPRIRFQERLVDLFTINEENPNRLKSLKICLLMVLCGCLFALILFLGTRNIPKNFYRIRDDGLITLSHAKNLIDYGFIGVNPSGERVEGYSAPVQFILYSFAYGIGKIHFVPFTFAQSIIFSFLLGLVLFTVNRSAPKKSFLIVLILAVLLTQITPFLEWQWSGMENAITHFLFAFSILALTKSIEKARINYWVIILLFLASISRAESMFHIGILLAIYAVFYFTENKSFNGLKIALLTLIPWMLYQLFRFLYFGSFSSNTEKAQEISLIENIKNVILFSQNHLSQSARLANQIFLNNGGFLLVLIAPLLIMTNLTAGDKQSTYDKTGYESRADKFLIFALLGLTLSAYFNPFIFGKTRLDLLRTTTQIAVYAAIFIAHVFGKLDLKKIGNIVTAGIIGLVGIFIIRANYVQPYHLCCEINDFDNFRQIITDIGTKNRIHRPMIANADLGVMSWYKQFNVVDLGKLGNPVLSHLQSESAQQEYLLLMKPDMLEIHTTWGIDYQFLLTDPAFQSAYTLLPIEYPDFFLNEPPYVQGIWLRNDIALESQSSERLLLNSQMQNLDIDGFVYEYSIAVNKGMDTTYITRTVYRFLPEIIRMNQYQELMGRLLQFHLSPFENYLLTGFNNGNAYQDVIKYLDN